MMTIIYDSREQTPFTFFDYPVKTEEGTLRTGDYSIKGFPEGMISLERKSLSDLISCFTKSGRERFKFELLRMRSYECRGVFCEGSLLDVESGNYRSNLPPQSALASIMSWQTEFNVPFIMAGSRSLAERCMFLTMSNFYRRKTDLARKLFMEVYQPKKGK